jgi:hypothetical protein
MPCAPVQLIELKQGKQQQAMCASDVLLSMKGAARDSSASMTVVGAVMRHLGPRNDEEPCALLTGVLLVSQDMNTSWQDHPLLHVLSPSQPLVPHLHACPGQPLPPLLEEVVQHVTADAERHAVRVLAAIIHAAGVAVEAPHELLSKVLDLQGDRQQRHRMRGVEKAWAKL